MMGILAKKRTLPPEYRIESGFELRRSRLATDGYLLGPI
jgi:hypothetical protein